MILAVCIVFSFAISPAYSAELKIGYIDIRRAFYEYEKTKTMEIGLNEFSEVSQDKRNTMIAEVNKLRDESELLAGKAKIKKEKQTELKFAELQEFDKTARQELLNKKNDMFRVVVDDIQVVADDLGKKGQYDFIIDSRNVMYGLEKYDLTDEVIQRLNK